MFKKILIYSGYTLLFAMVGAYFFFSTTLTRQEQSKLMCKTIKVTILDSAANGFVTKNEIIDLLRVEGITPNESKLKHINRNSIEIILNNRNAILKSQVSYTRDGILRVNILQRRPILRIETPNGGFYMDESAYIFPLVKTFTSYVPIVSGNIPLRLFPGHRGKAKKELEWSIALRDLGLFLEKDEFWSSVIEQIYIDEKGIIHLSPRIGEQEIIFGNLDNIEYKFKKLYVFYHDVMPLEGWQKYKSINLQFSNQIVCKKRGIDTTKNNINNNINLSI
jgi:cell division protein FtsQ